MLHGKIPVPQLDYKSSLGLLMHTHRSPQTPAGALVQCYGFSRSTLSFMHSWHGIVTRWAYGIVTRWAYGIVTRWAYGIVTRWAYGIVTRWAYGTVTRWAYGIVTRWAYGIVTRWAYGIVTRWALLRLASLARRLVRLVVWDLVPSVAHKWPGSRQMCAHSPSDSACFFLHS